MKNISKYIWRDGDIIILKSDEKSWLLRISIAKTMEEAIKGFSGRDHITDDEGLLIPLQSTTGIWMKDTQIPLTVAFLDSDYKVLRLTDLVPNDETVHMGPDTSMWALEASPKWFSKEGVNVGDIIVGLTELPGLPNGH